MSTPPLTNTLPNPTQHVFPKNSLWGFATAAYQIKGVVHEDGLAFYNRLVNGLIAVSIQPLITLFHWDLPPLHCQGGWLKRDIADKFADYADVLSKRLGDRVSRWCTLNQAGNIGAPFVTAISHISRLQYGLLRDRATLNLFLFTGPAEKNELTEKNLSALASKNGGKFSLISTKRLEELAAASEEKQK